MQHRNIVSATTILLLSILSAVSFTRGMAWIQVVWNWHVLDNKDLLLVGSFFAWLGMLATVHALFVWHTLKTDALEKNYLKYKASAHDQISVRKYILHTFGYIVDKQRRWYIARAKKNSDEAATSTNDTHQINQSILCEEVSMFVLSAFHCQLLLFIRTAQVSCLSWRECIS